MDGGAGTNLCY